MTDKLREEFEAWYSDDIGVAASLVRGWRKGDGYSSQYERCGLLWLGWQASRAALVIELPQSRADKGETANGDQSLLSALLANHLAIDECREAIKAAGLKVTP